MKPLRKHPKPETYKNPDYLAWIRTIPCIVCGNTTGVTPHHESGLGIGLVGGGTAKKCSDLAAIPLCCFEKDKNCRDCHGRRESKGYTTFWLEYGKIYLDEMIVSVNELELIADGIAMREVLKLLMRYMEKRQEGRGE